MKTALLICGLIPENFDKYYKSIHKTTIEPYNSDVFISTWSSNLSDDVLAVYKPKLYRIEDFKDVSIKHRSNNFIDFLKEINYTGNKILLFNSLYPMLYKVYDTNNLRKEYESFNNIKYDFVIRCRFDLSFDHKHPSISKEPYLYNEISKNEIEECLENKMIYLRMDGGGEFAWDHFAFGNSDSMNIYCDTFLNLKKLMRSHFVPNETILYWNLVNNGIELKHTSTVYGTKNYSKTHDI